MLMFIVLNTLFIPPFLLCFFSVGVLSLWQMFLRVSGVRGSLRLGGMLFWGTGVVSVVMVRVVLLPHFILGMIGFFQISMAFSTGFLILLRF